MPQYYVPDIITAVYSLLLLVTHSLPNSLIDLFHDRHSERHTQLSHSCPPTQMIARLNATREKEVTTSMIVEGESLDHHYLITAPHMPGMLLCLRTQRERRAEAPGWRNNSVEMSKYSTVLRYFTWLKTLWRKRRVPILLSLNMKLIKGVMELFRTRFLQFHI